jgi:hypothetical protein
MSDVVLGRIRVSGSGSLPSHRFLPGREVILVS